MPYQPIYSFPRQLVTKLALKQIGMFHVKHPGTQTAGISPVSRETGAAHAIVADADRGL